MTPEQMERAIEFLLEHHAKFSTDIGELREAISDLKDVQKQQGENLDKLAESVSVMQAEMDANRVEMREAIDKLILGNEVTRKLAEDVAQLAIQTSQRVTNLESGS